MKAGYNEVSQIGWACFFTLARGIELYQYDEEGLIMGLFSKKKPGVVECGVKSTFFVFVAKGMGIGSILSGARGVIGGGIKNADAWKEQLLGTYPGSRKMKFVLIENDEWEHPDVGFLNKETKIDVKPFIRAIQKHLTDKMEIPEKQSDDICAIIETNNMCVADFFDGALRFGVPV